MSSDETPLQDDISILIGDVTDDRKSEQGNVPDNYQEPLVLVNGAIKIGVPSVLR